MLLEKGVCYDQCILLAISISLWGTDLNYCDNEWFALEMNRDHSVVFEIAPKYCISDSSVDSEMATPLLLRDSCPHGKYNSHLN